MKCLNLLKIFSIISIPFMISGCAVYSEPIGTVGYSSPSTNVYITNRPYYYDYGYHPTPRPIIVNPPPRPQPIIVNPPPRPKPIIVNPGSRPNIINKKPAPPSKVKPNYKHRENR